MLGERAGVTPAGPVRHRPPESFGMQYLDAHELSAPSERYVYILWLILVSLGLLLGLEHLLGLTDRTILGALWSKWATSHYITHVLRAPRGDPASRGVAGRALHALQRHAFLSLDLGRITAVAVLLIPLLCLSLIGADYIDPGARVFGPAARAADAGHFVQWGLGTHAPVMTDRPTTTLPYHACWTVASRLGDMANALTPLVVLFALKQAPFALLSMPMFGSVSLDSLGFLHKWGGGLLWVYATVHTILWCVQITLDAHREPSVHLWSQLVAVPRFRWALVAYIFLTGLVVLSIGPIRSRNYELFYVVHVICVVGFTTATWAHHPQLGWWMLAALILWVMERFVRMARVIWINYSEKPALLREKAADAGRLPNATAWRSGDGTAQWNMPYSPQLSAKAFDFDSTTNTPRISLAHSPGQSTTSLLRSREPSWSNGMPAQVSAPFRPVVSRDLRTQLFPGYAFIQPLSGNMLRLVLRTASPLRWRPGQWLYLRLPQLSWPQSHPFTIASSYTKPKNNLFGQDATSDDQDQLVMLLIRARSGLTRRLWDHVQSECTHAAEAQFAGTGEATAFPLIGNDRVQSEVHGAYMRAIVDGPFGSSGRIDWGAYASSVIICGGSGVSFGIAILDYLCRQIARGLQGEAVRGKFGRPFLLRRVCFVWIMREFAHLQWAASAIRLCLEMLPPGCLSVQIHVTHVNEKQVLPPEEEKPAGPVFAGSHPVVHSVAAEPVNVAAQVTEGHDLDDVALHQAELTQFDLEEDTPLSAQDRTMNEHIMREGKLRRARTRGRSLRRAGPAAERKAPGPVLPPGVEHVDASLGYTEHHADVQAQTDLEPARPAPVPVTQALHTVADQALALSQTFASPTRPAVSSGLRREIPPRALDAHTPPAGQYLSPAPVVSSADDYFSATPPPLALSALGPGPYPEGAPIPLSTRRPSVPDTAPSSPALAAHTIPLSPPHDPGMANLDAKEIHDYEVVAELTRAGYPKLDHILSQEMDRADGRTLTVACGPAGLLAVVRSIVAKQVNIHQVWRGDLRGHASVYTESYDT